MIELILKQPLIQMDTKIPYDPNHKPKWSFCIHKELG